MAGRVLIGVSGWTYPRWRGDFYPPGLRQADELAYVAERMSSVELNGSFYSLQKPERYAAWRAATPEGFVIAVKGSRFITHLKQLRDIETPLANFLASGVLALGPRLGPLLWQLPPRLTFEPERIDAFLSLLPRSTAEAAALASRHDERLAGRSLTEAEADVPLRHALEVRHPSFATPEAVAMLRRHRVALVVADTAGRWPLLREVTADHVYVRLHGESELYTSGYGPDSLASWAAEVRAWTADGLDVHVYFDNDAAGRAPHDAVALQALLS